MSLQFWKYHGLGNDFLLVEGGEEAVDQGEVKRLCDRRRGIGADGVICVEVRGPSTLGMVIYNRDGSRPEMCGNGIRCVAAHGHWKWDTGRDISIDSDAGWKRCQITVESNARARVKVEMGEPTVEALELNPFSDGHQGPLRGIAVDIGNPHIVLFREADKALEAQERRRRLIALGRALNSDHSAFPEGVNVEWAIRREWGIEVWVYERGVGLTQACGTGACAAAAASWLEGGSRDKEATTVALPGGRLQISSGPSGLMMEGEAEAIGMGTWPLKWER